MRFVDKERAFRVLLFLCAIVTVAFVGVIIIYLFVAGIPAIKEIGLRDFLFGTEWRPESQTPQFGILPFILTSVYGTVGAILLGVPLGVLCAVFIAKIAPRSIRSMLKTTVELLAGIPSVVFGLIGMTVLVPFVQRVFNLPSGANLFSSIIVLSVMILPSVVNVSENALRSVPKEYELGSLALGANRVETALRVSMPAAKSGIAASIVLGVGRSIGETMAVMMVSGNVANMPSLFKSVRYLTTAVSGEMSYSSGLHRKALFSIALVLLLFLLIINLSFKLLIRQDKK
ncbi:MAG: phosphate ABC transporter permease subunit PstC [Ruminococcaceae bacterium]|nr:phosphate ABC transporter permease subunit PstC [Oscillospiraceae bacterium]